MKIIELNPLTNFHEDNKLKDVYLQFEQLIIELRKRELPDEIVVAVNSEIEAIHSFTGSANDLRKLIIKKQSGMITLIEKKLKIVPKNYYQRQWMALGISFFGLSIGVALGTSLGNMAYLGIGLPIGMAVGLIYGTKLDNESSKEGRQLDFEMK